MRLAIKTNERGFGANPDDYLFGIEFRNAAEAERLAIGLVDYAVEQLQSVTSDISPEALAGLRERFGQSEKAVDSAVEFMIVNTTAGLTLKALMVQAKLLKGVHEGSIGDEPALVALEPPANGNDVATIYHNITRTWDIAEDSIFPNVSPQRVEAIKSKLGGIIPATELGRPSSPPRRRGILGLKKDR